MSGNTSVDAGSFFFLRRFCLIACRPDIHMSISGSFERSLCFAFTTRPAQKREGGNLRLPFIAGIANWITSADVVVIAGIMNPGL
jgi:hypothetical protein